MRRTVRRTSAAIFSKRNRMVSTCAVSHSVPASPATVTLQVVVLQHDANRSRQFRVERAVAAEHL